MRVNRIVSRRFQTAAKQPDADAAEQESAASHTAGIAGTRPVSARLSPNCTPCCKASNIRQATMTPGARRPRLADMPSGTASSGQQRQRQAHAPGAEEEAVRAGRRGVDQRTAMHLALQDRKAVPVRPQAAGEDRVAVVEQVMRGDGRAQRGVRARVRRSRTARPRFVVMCSNTIRSAGKAARNGISCSSMKTRSRSNRSIAAIGHFAVDRAAAGRPPASLSSAGQQLPQVGHARSRVGGRAGGVELDAVHEACCPSHA